MKVFSREKGTHLKHTRVISDTPGRFRLRVLPKYRQSSKMRTAASTFKSSFPACVCEVRTNEQSGSMTVYYVHESSLSESSEVLLENLDALFGDVPPEKSEEISTAESLSIAASVPESRTEIAELTSEGVENSSFFESELTASVEPQREDTFSTSDTESIEEVVDSLSETESSESNGSLSQEDENAVDPIIEDPTTEFSPCLTESVEDVAEAVKGSLRQSELARRLQVSESTLNRHRNNEDFPHWSQQKDPESIAWHFDEGGLLFYPSE